MSTSSAALYLLDTNIINHLMHDAADRSTRLDLPCHPRHRRCGICPCAPFAMGKLAI